MRIKDKAKPKVPAIEPGVYMAVCVGVIDLGEQYMADLEITRKD